MIKQIMALLFILTVIDLNASTLIDSGFQARAAGMGNAFSALADDSSAVYYNPALLYNIEEMQVALGYSHLYLTQNLLNASFIYPKIYNKPDVGIALGWCSLMDENDMMKYSATSHGKPGDYQDGGTFDYGENFFIAGSGVKIANFGLMQWSAGAAFKLFTRQLDDFKSQGYGLDLGINTKHKFFNVSFGLKNLAASFKSDSGRVEEDIPMIIRVGTLIRIQRIIKETFSTAENQPTSSDSTAGIPSEDFNYIVNPVIDAEIVLDKETEFRIFSGLEGWLNRTVSLRFGYNNFQGLSFGGSARVEMVQVDYAYTVHSELDNSHRLTGTFFF